jgi:hypothetical protein
MQIQTYTVIIYSRVGWYWNLDKSTTEVCDIPFKSNENKQKKVFGPSDRFIIGQSILGHALYRGTTKYFHNMDFMGIKSCKILRRFQKY